MRWDLAEARHRIGFVNEDVATVAVVDEGFGLNGVTGNYDGAVRRFEPEAEGIDHVLMPRRKCRDRDVSVLVDNAWHDLVRVDIAAGRSFSMKAVTARGDVDLPGFEDVRRHRLDPFRTINGERIVSSRNPGGEYEIGIADRVVGWIGW